MIDRYQAGYWLIAFGLFVVVPLVATRSAFFRRLAGRLMVRLLDWAREHLVPEPEVDPMVMDMYRARQRQQLYADIARLQRILADDESMSATRQLGNRIAYDWLLAEHARTRDLPGSIFVDDFLDDWNLGPSATSNAPVEPLLVRGSRQGSTVEVLDIGWRS